ncbi:MAG: transcription elongation factor GreA [Clostridia bacterium]|nr:transcription elongation factor GreA [Clostridia bacterium]
MKKVLLTEEGLNNLKNELEYLKAVRRKEVAEKIKVALSFGDLSENSEYDEAKNEQAILEAKILDIETRLQNVEIIEQSELDADKIHIGSKIRIKDLDFDEICEYRIVGSSESNPMQGLISDESPVGKGLLGSKVGDTVVIEIPSGTATYEILEINIK